MRPFSVCLPSDNANDGIVAVLTSRKTGGAECCVALYAMVASTPAPIPDVMPLVLKETSANLPLLASLLPRALLSGTVVDSAMWAKELWSSSLMALRKALAAAAGDVFLADESIPSSELCHQVCGSMLLSKPPRRLLSQVRWRCTFALAVLLGGKPREPFAKTTPFLVAVLRTAQKPGLLILDKFYTKFATAEEERRISHAAQVATTAHSLMADRLRKFEHPFASPL